MIAPRIVELTGLLRERGLHITIETAGTVYAPVAAELMSISPKLSNSTPEGPWAIKHDRLRIQPVVLRRLMTEYAYQLKFVVAKVEDLDEVRELVTRLQGNAGRVILMPEGTDPETLRERGQWLVESCKELGYRYSPRLHVELWGHRRGV